MIRPFLIEILLFLTPFAAYAFLLWAKNHDVFHPESWPLRTLVLLTAVALVLIGMEGKGIYSKPVDELVAQKTKFIGKSVRAEGNLVHGSLVKREDPCEYRFKIEKNGTEIPVRFAKCVVPDTFRDVPGVEVGVTVEGELRSDDSLEASQVLAKCPSKYEMKQKAAQGEKAPHASLAP